MEISSETRSGDCALSFEHLDSIDYEAQLEPPFVRSFTIVLTPAEREEVLLLLQNSA